MGLIVWPLTSTSVCAGDPSTSSKRWSAFHSSCVPGANCRCATSLPSAFTKTQVRRLATTTSSSGTRGSSCRSISAGADAERMEKLAASWGHESVSHFQGRDATTAPTMAAPMTTAPSRRHAASDQAETGSFDQATGTAASDAGTDDSEAAAGGEGSSWATSGSGSNRKALAYLMRNALA